MNRKDQNNVIATFKLYIIKTVNVLVFKIKNTVLLSQNLTFILNIRKYSNTAVKKNQSCGIFSGCINDFHISIDIKT